jgi:hypothetical protein
MNADLRDFGAERLASAATFARPDEVYEIYRRLRRDAPLIHVAPEGYRPFWLLTRHDDIVAVERDAETFRAGDRTMLLPEKVEEIYLRKYGDRNGVRPLTHMDGDYHRAHRMVTLDWFNPRNLRAFEPQVAAIARDFVDRMEDFGSACDFARDIAFLYPLRVILTLMGVPREDEALVLEMTQRLFSPADKDLSRQGGPEGPRAGGGDAIASFAEYFDAVTRDRRAHPRNDIASTLANGQVDGRHISARELLSYYIIVATAGHDTTAASTAAGLLGLMTFPEQHARLKEDPGLTPLAADEFIRFAAPVKHFMRTPQADVEIHGQTVKAGEAIMLAYASACRDESIFADPDQLDVGRNPNPHLAFGHGPHFCLGKHLAKMEIAAFYRELLPRLRTIELAGEPTYIESTFVSGLKSLPVRFTF